MVTLYVNLLKSKFDYYIVNENILFKTCYRFGKNLTEDMYNLRPVSQIDLGLGISLIRNKSGTKLRNQSKLRFTIRRKPSRD